MESSIYHKNYYNWTFNITLFQYYCLTSICLFLMWIVITQDRKCFAQHCCFFNCREMTVACYRCSLTYSTSWWASLWFAGTHVQWAYWREQWKSGKPDLCTGCYCEHFIHNTQCQWAVMHVYIKAAAHLLLWSQSCVQWFSGWKWQRWGGCNRSHSRHTSHCFSTVSHCWNTWLHSWNMHQICRTCWTLCRDVGGGVSNYAVSFHWTYFTFLSK